MTLQSKILIQSRATRNGWLKAIYKNGLVISNEETAKLTDKLYSFQIFKSFMGENVLHYLPKTLGLHEFQKTHDLQNLNSITEIQNILSAEFPCGYLLKPTSAINSAGIGPDFIFDENKIVKLIFDKESFVSQAMTSTFKYRSELTQIMASGEKYILQEKIGSTNKLLKSKTLPEIRVHSYENQVVPLASGHRWLENPVQKAALFHQAENFVFNFLQQIPFAYLKNQAWSFDVLISSSDIKIVDINTNRGLQSHWSGTLSYPTVLGAYSRHFEKQKNIRFTGFNGFLLRHDFANYFKLLKKRHIEGIQ